MKIINIKYTCLTVLSFLLIQSVVASDFKPIENGKDSLILIKTKWPYKKRVIKQGEKIDYLAFVPDGEPTLDINLAKNIDLLNYFGKKEIFYQLGL